MKRKSLTITVSGGPAQGKSTVVRTLFDLFKTWKYNVRVNATDLPNSIKAFSMVPILSELTDIEINEVQTKITNTTMNMNVNTATMNVNTATFLATPTFTRAMLSDLIIVLNDLLVPNNSVSTLEVKTELRKRFANTTWNQKDISSAMDFLYHAGHLTYKDNGTFRTYAAVNQPTKVAQSTIVLSGYGGVGGPAGATGIKVSTTPTSAPAQGSPAPKAAKPTKRQVTTKRIGKNDAMRIMMDTNGKFFGVTFIKKDGSIRNMTCRIDKTHNGPDTLGYLRVIDATEQVSKKLNLQTLSEVRTNRTIYTVR
jgi:hypothetical protein